VSDQVPAGQAAGAARAEGKCVPLRGRFLITFNKAEIVDVIEQASRWTCRNFTFTDEVARGKITIISKTPVSAEEAYAAFLSALAANGIAIYPSGKYNRLVRMSDSKKTPIPTAFGDDSETPATEQPITKVIRVSYAEPDQLRGVLSNFISPQGADIQSIPPDILVITDIGLNIRKIERLISAIDKPGSGDLIRVVQVQYASAKDVAEKVNQVFASSPGQAGRPGQRRPVIRGPQPGGVPAPAGTSGDMTEISITKVLADDRTNKLIIIADEKSYQRILELLKQLDIPTNGEGGIHVVFLKNANAEELAQTLQALAQGQSSSRRAATGYVPPPQTPGMPGTSGAGRSSTTGSSGSTSADLFGGEVKVTADKQQNALIVMANGSDFATMERLIEKLDRPRRQVFIEAVIMEVDLNDESQFGVSMHGAKTFKTGSGTGVIPIASETGRVQSYNLASLLSLGGFMTGLAGPVSADLKDLLGPSFPSIGVLVQALQTNSNVNVLSTPHIMASDNEEAEISVGTNEPFQSGYSPNLSSLTSSTTTAATTASLLSGGLSSLYAPIQRQNVELKLKIKPQINEGDMVRLELEEQTEDIASRDAQLGPTTAKRSVKTNIVAKDQNTIVIGGLIQEKASKSVHKIPILGDIPILGWLFRDTVTTKRKTNLLLFLTPYIIRDQSDYRRIFELKRKEHEEYVRQFYGEKATYQVPIDYQRKAGAYTQMHKDVEAESLKRENGGPGLPGEKVIGPGVDRGEAGSTEKGVDAASAPTAKPGSATDALPAEEPVEPGVGGTEEQPGISP
jgi:general secretion pathway protein D